MGYIYRYTDCNDGIIKYVGIVWSDNRKLSQRINEHQDDYWYNKGDWKIEYLEKDISSRTDAEYIESHLISLYHTDKWFNRSKAEWGVSSYIDIDESDWKDYNYQPINDRICSFTVMLSSEEYDKLSSMSKDLNRSCNSTIRHLISNSQDDYYRTDSSECYRINVSFDDMIKYYQAFPDTTTKFVSKLSINVGICKDSYIIEYTFSLNKDVMSCTWQQQVDGKVTKGVHNYDISNGSKDLSIYAIAVPCHRVCTNDKDVANYLIGQYSTELSYEKKKSTNILISDLFLEEMVYDSRYTILGLEDIDTYFYCSCDKNTIILFVGDSEKEIDTEEFLRKYGMYDCCDRNCRIDYINQLENKIHKLSECL